MMNNKFFTLNSGYHGHLGCTIQNSWGNSVIEKGMRIGQIEFQQAEKSTKLYAGGYSHIEGTDPNHVK